MVTSHKSTIHRAVVGLIVRTGTGRIEAERQWDSVYSAQYDRAVPGVTHTWKIGAYDFEFTKVFEGRDRSPLDVIEQNEIPQASSKLFGWVAFFALLTIVTFASIYIF
jgi:hypothetical protein